MATIGERPRLDERASGMKKIGDVAHLGRPLYLKALDKSGFPLTFHLAQAGLSFRCFRQIARLLKERLGLS